MAGNPFDNLNRDIVNASDYTRKLTDTTRWKSLQQNMANQFGSNPLKKNGKRYQNDFIISIRGSDDPLHSLPDPPNKSGGLQGCVVGAKSYELFQSVSRGKFYANPSLDGAAAAKYDMWFANCLSIEYQTGCGSDGSDCGDYFPPVIMTNLYSSLDASNSPYFTDDTGTNKIGFDMVPFPSTCLDDCSYNGLVPGFIEDPSNVIFGRKCIGSLAPVSRPVQTNLSQAEGWLRNLANIRFKNSPYYWKGVLAQPLNKYTYPHRVPLWYQGPSEESDFRPQTLGRTDERSDKLIQAFCEGCSAFN